jgi:cell volume regulation protein A
MGGEAVFTLDGLAQAVVIGGAVVLLAVVGVRFAGRLGLPGLLLYLGIGLLLGNVSTRVPFGPSIGPLDPELATVLGYAALIIILAQGGLTTRWSQLRPVLGPSIALATVGVAVSVTVVALPLIWFAGLDPRIAILLSAVLAATDAAAVFSVLRRVPILPRLRTLLEGEAGLNDAPVVVLVAVVASGAMTAAPWLIPLVVVGELVGGGLIGILIGLGTRWLLPRLALPAVGLYPIAVLTPIVAAYGIADLLHVSGFIAVYLSAVIVGSSSALPHQRAVKGFSDGLAWVAEIGLFIMLGLLVDVSRLPAAIGIALAAALLLLVLGRPLSAIIALAPFRWPARCIAFVSVTGLRGAVPIVFAAIPLGLAMPGAEIVFDATFIVVLILTLVQTPALPWVARRLGVAVAQPAGELDVDSAPLDGVNAVMLGLSIPKDSRLVGVFVREIGLPQPAAVSLVIRERSTLVPDSETRLRAGDQIVVVTTPRARDATERRLRAISREGRLAVWRGDAGDDV